MGIYDREYYRDEDQSGGFHISTGGHSVVTYLLVINIALFVADMFFTGANQHWLTNTLKLQSDALVKPWLWWQFLTCGFVHAPWKEGLPWHILGNMFVLWMFGRDVERVYGRGEFLRIYLLVIVLGAVIWALRIFSMGVAGTLSGASGATTAVLMLFICHFPRRTLLLNFFIPVPAWVVGVVVVVTNLLGMRGTESGIAFDVHLVGIAFAFAYFKFRWNLGRFMPGDGLVRDLRLRMKQMKPGTPSLRIHDGEAEDQYRDLDDEADRLLDKVHREGQESLTNKERQLLEDYSRRMRQKHR